tara:strand:+ start:7077 stop:7316 length:240 start_codon:yes stop_codon:yes gene_type:complete
MCLGARSSQLMPTTPLPPPPPAPPVPPPPLPEAKPLDEGVNPQVRRAKRKRSQQTGISQLRIPLKTNVNVPTSGGINEG